MTFPRNVQERLDRLTRRCAAAGLPLTTQRRAIMEVLAGRSDHPTVDQIYTSVVEKLPEVSRTTVYRALEVLAELKLLKRVEHPNSAVRFDANMDPHHHFLCTRCGALSDLPLEAVRGYEKLKYVGDPSATADELAIFVHGLCGSCAEAAGQGES